MNEIKRNLLDKCYRLGLPVSSNDSIGTLQMFLEADSKLDVENYDFQVAKQENQNNLLKSFLLKISFFSRVTVKKQLGDKL